MPCYRPAWTVEAGGRVIDIPPPENVAIVADTDDEAHRIAVDVGAKLAAMFFGAGSRFATTVSEIKPS